MMGRHIQRSYVISSPTSEVIHTAESDHSNVTGNASIDDVSKLHVTAYNGLDISQDERVTVGNTTTEQNVTQNMMHESAGREDDFTENNILTYCYSPTTTHKNYGTGDEAKPAATSQNQRISADSAKEPIIPDTANQSTHNCSSVLLEAQKSDGLLCTTVSNSQENAQQRGVRLCGTVHKSPPLCWVFSRLGLTDFRWRMGLVCLSAYFSIGVIYMFALMSTDYVGKAIYGGDPRAEPESEGLVKYQAGVRMAAWGFLVYYCVYMVFNPFHERVLARLGEDYVNILNIFVHERELML